MSFMSEEYGSDFITIMDEEGNEFELEHLDTIEYSGEVYMAFLPADQSDEETPEMIILKVFEEDGEELLEIIEDDDELQRVYEKFMENLFEDEE